MIAAYKRWMDQALPTTLFDPFFQSTVPATNNRIECSRNGLQKLTKSRYSRLGNWKLRLTMNLKHHIMWKIYRPQNLNCKFADKKMEEDEQTSKKIASFPFTYNISPHSFFQISLSCWKNALKQNCKEVNHKQRGKKSLPREKRNKKPPFTKQKPNNSDQQTKQSAAAANGWGAQKTKTHTNTLQYKIRSNSNLQTKSFCA